jgi:hypothetical protein
LPFIVLIRGAVWLNTSQDFGIWPSMVGSIVITTLILFIYMTFIYGRFTGKLGDKDNLKRRALFAFLVVLGFSIQGLVFLSNDNIKTSEIKKEYTSLHPFLRLGVSTIILLDRKLVVTDANRVPEDYAKMGLKKKGQSLHYEQKDGFTYAIDLRTNNRSEFRNQALAVYFGAMGFNVLRHVGSADHLHISMKCKFHPGAK